MSDDKEATPVVQETMPVTEEPKVEEPKVEAPNAEAAAETVFVLPAPSGLAPSEAPLVTEEVEVQTNEEEEEILLKFRAKLYRMATECTPPEWKERGTGELKLLKHKESKKIRVLMRRDKTLKICANHYIHPIMELEENCSSDRSWLYKTPVDFSDGNSGGEELLAVRFASVESARIFKEVFDASKLEMQAIMDAAIAEGKNNA